MKKIKGSIWTNTLDKTLVYRIGNKAIKDKLSKYGNKSIKFYDTTGVLRATLDCASKSIIVERGYAWDGCSPKWVFLDLIVGTPDGAINPNTGKTKTYYGSLVHDVIYQFLDDPQMIFDRKDADKIFYESLLANKFFWSYIYYVAVRLFGGIVHSYRTRSVSKTDIDLKIKRK